MTDRREKLANCLRLDSMLNYLIISQHEPWVEHYFRDADGTWRQETLVREGTLRISCLDLDLSLATIYEDLSPPPPPGSADPW